MAKGNFVEILKKLIAKKISFNQGEDTFNLNNYLPLSATENRDR